MKTGLKINKGKIFLTFYCITVTVFKGMLINEFEKISSIYILFNDSSQDGIFQ
ncbi:hypothetical protein BCSAG_48460 [Bacillus cereus]